MGRAHVPAVGAEGGGEGGATTPGTTGKRGEGGRGSLEGGRGSLYPATEPSRRCVDSTSPATSSWMQLPTALPHMLLTWRLQRGRGRGWGQRNMAVGQPPVLALSSTRIEGAGAEKP